MEQAAVLMLVFICVSTFINMYMTYRCQHNFEHMQSQHDKYKDKIYELLEERANEKFQDWCESKKLADNFIERVEKVGLIVQAFGDKVKQKDIKVPEAQKTLNWRQKKKIKEQAKV